MDTSISKKILWAYFEGKATPPQKHLLLEWLKNPSHQDVFFEVLNEWEKANPQMLPDLPTEWQNILSRLDQVTGDKQISLQPAGIIKSPGKLWYRLLAASVSLLLVCGWWQRDLLLYKTYSAEYGETKSFTLADGSEVTLNADSKLIYPRFKWFQPCREVKLWGEANFSVIHTNDNRPFLVRTSDQLEVQVLGTEFLVYSRRGESKVVLSRGKVRLRSLKNNRPPLNILPGDVVTVDARGGFQLVKEENIVDYLAWKEHRFVFNRTPLASIAVQIQERFGVQVEISDTLLAATRLSGYYPAENADEIIFMLTRLLNVRSEKLSEKLVRISNN